MNALVIYDSQYGNTEKVAHAIARSLSALGQARAVRVGVVSPRDWQEVDLLVLGCPTQAWGATRAMQAFLTTLAEQSLPHVVAVCFDTRFKRSALLTGSAAKRIAKQLRQLGVPLLLPPESFFVSASEGPLIAGELERAATWARMAHDECLAHTRMAHAA